MTLDFIPDLPTDSANYDVLTRGVIRASNVPGLTCEIGLRRGGGTKAIVDAIVESGAKKTHIAIDPYGNIEYVDSDTRVLRGGYTNAMRDECLVNLYLYCRRNEISFYFFNLEDSEFFRRYADGVPTYEHEKRIVNEYSFVHFDGPHSAAAVAAEVEFFHTRARPGAVFVFDDVNVYDHRKVDDLLEERDWELYETSERKWAYYKR